MKNTIYFTTLLYYILVSIINSIPIIKKQPNIILILTDDLDQTLGSFNHALPKTKKLIGDAGATATNWFVHTPVCCPSRSELLTGRYFHNIRVSNHSSSGCMFVNVSTDTNKSPFYKEPDLGGWYFAPHFQSLNYTVGVFGKHLNSDNPTSPPVGVDRWFVNGGGNYNNPTFSVANVNNVGVEVTFNNCTYGPCYSTSIIGNETIRWIDSHHNSSPAPKPFFAYVAVKSPHIQDGPGFPVAIPAPWYKNTYKDIKPPRTPNWNYTCTTCHWLIRTQPKMTLKQCEKSDELYRTRLQSLLSVDDLVNDVIHKLIDLNIDTSTYIIFTSDHGFQFGQYGMPEGKWNAYEHDIRVPFLIRGPNIPVGSIYSGLGSNVDVMPTLYELAGGLNNDNNQLLPLSMDGDSIAKWFLNTNKTKEKTIQLIEYFGLGPVIRYEHLEDTPNNTFRLLRLMDPSRNVGERNIMYGEWTNKNWNYQNGNIEEYELFNLDDDPYQLINIYNNTSNTLKHELHTILEKKYVCQGESCRSNVGEDLTVRF